MKMERMAEIIRATPELRDKVDLFNFFVKTQRFEENRHAIKEFCNMCRLAEAAIETKRQAQVELDEHGDEDVISITNDLAEPSFPRLAQ